MQTQQDSWPPAIPPPILPTQDIAFNRVVRKGRVSVWLVGAGIALGFGAIGMDQLASWFTVSFDNAVLVAALVCEFISLIFGIVSRKTRIGKVGLVLSLLIVTAVSVLVLASHARDGIWPWQDDCGCDNLP